MSVTIVSVFYNPLDGCLLVKVADTYRQSTSPWRARFSDRYPQITYQNQHFCRLFRRFCLFKSSTIRLRIGLHQPSESVPSALENFCVKIFRWWLQRNPARLLDQSYSRVEAHPTLEVQSIEFRTIKPPLEPLNPPCFGGFAIAPQGRFWLRAKIIKDFPMSWAIKPPLVSEGFEIFENKGGLMVRNSIDVLALNSNDFPAQIIIF